MILQQDSSKPIYVQIADWLETEILSETFSNDEKVYSQYQLAEIFTINPATAAKGLNILVEEGILYKKRGLGMFVATNAKERILQKRTSQTLKRLVEELVLEANRLNVSEVDLIEMIQAANKRKGDFNDSH